ncbi:MAG TPA: copper chaperone CopZ [Firmicutes bacterium]|jgi:copper chaperone|nr:copper chaperone CopZ [Bacillota bacterium]
MESITLHVEGMSCNHCKMAVTNALKSLTGVGDVNVDLNAKQVIVQYQPTQVSVSAMREAIEEEGYTVK